MNENYEYLDKELFLTYLDTDLLPLPEKKSDYFINDRYSVELILRPECNQNCSYCYLVKHRKDLYPSTPKTKEEILQNVDMVLDFIYNKRRNFIYTFELFAGDMFFDDIFFDVLDLLDKYLKPIKETNIELFFTKDPQFIIEVPCNLTWVYTNPEKIEKFRKYFCYLRDEYGIFLSMSWSTDGLYATDSREKKELQQEYFDKIFEFCREFSFGPHPMIAAENIDNWIKNYDWWLEMYDKHNLACQGFFQPYLLEVRNNNWTPEKNDLHDKFLTHVMKRRLEMCNNSYEELAYHLLVGDGANNTLYYAAGCDPLALKNDFSNPEGDKMGCGLPNMIAFNCIDLNLVLCHRTSYKHLVPVYFIPNEEKTEIIDYKINNIASYILLKNMKVSKMPVCATCNYRDVCKRGCYGAQIEDSGEILMPITSVCNFFKQKYDTLVKLYNEYKIVEYGLANNWIDYNIHSFLIRRSYEMGYLK